MTGLQVWDPISKHFLKSEYEYRTCREAGRLARLAVNSTKLPVLSWIWSISHFYGFLLLYPLQKSEKIRKLTKSNRETAISGEHCKLVTSKSESVLVLWKGLKTQYISPAMSTSRTEKPGLLPCLGCADPRHATTTSTTSTLVVWESSTTAALRICPENRSIEAKKTEN